MDLLVPVFYLALHVHVYSVLQFHQSNFFIACNFHVFFMYLHSNVYHYFYAPVGFSRKRSVLCNQCVSPLPIFTLITPKVFNLEASNLVSNFILGDHS